jgi:hypothetical protein
MRSSSVPSICEPPFDDLFEIELEVGDVRFPEGLVAWDAPLHLVLEKKLSSGKSVLLGVATCDWRRVN